MVSYLHVCVVPGSAWPDVSAVPAPVEAPRRSRIGQVACAGRNGGLWASPRHGRNRELCNSTRRSLCCCRRGGQLVLVPRDPASPSVWVLPGSSGRSYPVQAARYGDARAADRRALFSRRRLPGNGCPEVGTFARCGRSYRLVRRRDDAAGLHGRGLLSLRLSPDPAIGAAPLLSDIFHPCRANRRYGPQPVCRAVRR